MEHKVMIDYCDYIASRTKKALVEDSKTGASLVAGVGAIKFDLNDDGSFKSSKKTILVKDINGGFYEISIERKQ